jgi:integrase
MGYAEKHGRGFRGRFRGANGKLQIARNPVTGKNGLFTSKRKAEQAAADEEAKIRSGGWIDPALGKMTFSDYFENHWYPNRVAEKNTLQGYMSHYNKTLKDAFGSMALARITPAVVQRWVAAEQRAGTGAGTIKAKHRTLQTCLAGQKGVSALRDGLIQTNPCKGTDLPVVDKRKKSIYTVEEVDALMATIGPWWTLLVLLGAESGLRWGELLGLEVRDFAENFRVITVGHTIIEITSKLTDNGTPYEVKPRPKGKLPRVVAVADPVATLVKATVRERQLFPADRLFSMPCANGLPERTPEWPGGLPVGRSYFRNSVWHPVHVEAGIERGRRRFHDVRGSHLSWLLAGGADVVTVMERAGHEDLATTMAYVNAMPDKDKRALDALANMQKQARKQARKAAGKAARKAEHPRGGGLGAQINNDLAPSAGVGTLFIAGRSRKPSARPSDAQSEVTTEEAVETSHSANAEGGDEAKKRPRERH